MNTKVNLKELAFNYNQKRKIDENTLSEILDSISKGLDIRPANKVLDIGCGTGRILLPLALKNKRSNFLGMDISGDMLNLLNQDVKKTKTKNVEALKYDANKKLQLGNNTLDSVLLYHSYHIIQNKINLISELNRVLKPSGRLLIASTSHTQLATTLNYKYIPKMLKREFERTPDLIDIVKSFRDKGFTLISIKEIFIKRKFENIDDWLNFLSKKPISALTFFDNKKLEKLLTKMRTNLITNFGNFTLEYGFDYHTQMFFKKND